MDLPPRVKTQHPNKENIAHDEIVPIPIESAFFLEDADKDSSKMNRYYFNYPGNWITSNRGESIVGIRSMWLVSRRRKLEFRISLVKFKKKDFIERGFTETNLVYPDNFEKILSVFEKEKKEVYYCDFKVVDWISTENDLRGLFNAINSAYKSYLSDNPNANTDIFIQSDINVLNRDIQTDGFYDDKGFHEIIYSERNKNFEKNKADSSYIEPYIIGFKIYDYNDDFKDVFNIGTGPFENNPEIFNKYTHEIIFNNIWDRHSCRIYSSIGEQSQHQYLGNSQIYFNPIKYFKLNSSDQRFWIELYSARHYNVPVKLPKNETFCIEMQFLPFNKLLYV